MSEPAESLLYHIRDSGLIPPDTTGVVAVSGGADSLALLHLLTRLRDELRITLTSATFDHGLRGELGYDDALYTAELAIQWGVPCAVGRGQLDPDALGIETRAREARYRFLAACAHDVGASWVATAHHADDQAETVLLNIVRGTGIHGLGGMRPKANLPYASALTLLRPLLQIKRAELEAYCRANGITWRDDPTNIDTRFRRNWARHVAMPVLREANPNLTGALNRLAEIAAEEDDYLEQMAASLLEYHTTMTQGRVWIDRTAFETWHPALQTRVLIWAAEQADPDAEPDYGHVKDAQALLNAATGGTVEFRGGVIVSIDTGYVMVARKDTPFAPPYAGYWLPKGYEAEVTESGVVTPFGWTVTPHTHNKETDQTFLIHISPASEWREGQGVRLSLRTRRDGDRVRPRGMVGGSQKLKDWLINRKVPRLLRDHLPLLVAGEHIAAVWDGHEWVTFGMESDAGNIEQERISVTMFILL